MLGEHRSEALDKSTRRQTLVDMHHPAFREGYQQGREQYFQDQTTFTDMHLMVCLQDVFVETELGEAITPEDDVYHAIGQLVGQISGCVIPCQPDEGDTKKLQEAFLQKVVRMYGETGAAVSDAVRQFWAAQDQLAQLFDVDMFELMLNRGVERASGGH
jgi:hypothetical protein